MLTARRGATKQLYWVSPPIVIVSASIAAECIRLQNYKKLDHICPAARTGLIRSDGVQQNRCAWGGLLGHQRKMLVICLKRLPVKWSYDFDHALGLQGYPLT